MKCLVKLMLIMMDSWIMKVHCMSIYILIKWLFDKTTKHNIDIRKMKNGKKQEWRRSTERRVWRYQRGNDNLLSMDPLRIWLLCFHWTPNLVHQSINVPRLRRKYIAWYRCWQCQSPVSSILAFYHDLPSTFHCFGR